MKSTGHIWRNAAKTAIFAGLTVTTSLHAATPSVPDSATANDVEAPSAQTRARATSSRQIYSVFLASTDCAEGIAEGLNNAHIRIGQAGEEVDVILTVKLKPIKAWYTHWALLDDYLLGIFTRASYEAKLTGNGNQVLLTLHGEERALTGREMCQDIGDAIADKLVERRQ